jgi:hypothetical protein
LTLGVVWKDGRPIGRLPAGAFERSIVFYRFLNIYRRGDALYSGLDAFCLQLVALFAGILLEVFTPGFPVRFKTAFNVDPCGLDVVLSSYFGAIFRLNLNARIELAGADTKV